LDLTAIKIVLTIGYLKDCSVDWLNTAVGQDIFGMLKVQQWINARRPKEKETVKCGEQLPILNANQDTVHLVAASVAHLYPVVDPMA